MARHDRGFARLGGFEGVFLQVKAQLGFALLFVRAVASETIFGEDGPDFAVEINRRRWRGRGPARKAAEQRCHDSASQNMLSDYSQSFPQEKRPTAVRWYSIQTLASEELSAFCYTRASQEAV